MIYSDYYKNYYKNIFDRVVVTNDASEMDSSIRAVKRLGLPRETVESDKDIPREYLNSRTLLITARKGQTAGKCPGTRRHICCNYLTVDQYLGCTLGCSYCIMKSYLNFSPVTVYADSGPAVQELKRIASLNKDRIVRAGTGETGDSLQFDPLFEITEEFITSLADISNLYFEAKTKTPFVDHLLDIKRKGNAVISFSLNPQSIIDIEEKEAFSLEERLEAAGKAAAAGYNLAFHFDPVICYPGWEENYSAVIKRLGNFPDGKIKWISLGTFRYPPALKEKMEDRPYLYDEFVPCADGKYRYMQKIRKEVYRNLYQKLKAATGSSIYMCMESPAVWRYAAGGVPGELDDVRWLFTKIKGLTKKETA